MLSNPDFATALSIIVYNRQVRNVRVIFSELLPFFYGMKGFNVEEYWDELSILRVLEKNAPA